MLEVSVNRERKALMQAQMLGQAIQEWGFNPDDMLLIALNHTIIVRDQWMKTEVNCGDQIDIFQPIVGG